uniref:Uncharacterized protein n=1 Tax=Clytia hemisphaerica TaxID=252671 RepID=A0A7M5XLA1_9CNID
MKLYIMIALLALATITSARYAYRKDHPQRNDGSLWFSQFKDADLNDDVYHPGKYDELSKRGTCSGICFAGFGGCSSGCYCNFAFNKCMPKHRVKRTGQKPRTIIL